MYFESIQFKWYRTLKYTILLLFVSVLDVEAFERLLGPCMQLMKRNIDDYEEQMLKIFGSKPNMKDIR